MKIYLNKSVYEEAIERLEFIFDEFENVIVSFSGGKDSTVTLELALEIARKKNRLPLKVYFLDQEAEWDSVIEYVKRVMYRKEIDPIWIQVPIFLPNSLSQEMPFIVTWDPDKTWMREKDPIAITEGHVLKGDMEKEAKTGYWYNYFIKSIKHLFGDEPACFLAGMRADESPKRLGGLTTGQTYKHITYGKVLDKKRDQYTFYPLYDWCLSDVWKYIHDNELDYCTIYNEYYRYGIAVKDMRVSNLHHESAVKSLFHLHEVEPDTWERLQKRLKGINQAKHIKQTEMLATKILPPMFKNWKEYRDHLTNTLILRKNHREIFFKEWDKMDELYDQMRHPTQMYQQQIKAILVNDIEFAKLGSYLQSPPIIAYRDWKKGKLGRRARPIKNLVQIKEEYLHA